MGNTLNFTVIVILYLQLISIILYTVFSKSYTLLVLLINCAKIWKGKLYCYIKRQVISNTSNLVQTCRGCLSIAYSRKVHSQNAWDSFIDLCVSLSVKAFSPIPFIMFFVVLKSSNNTEKRGLTSVVSVAHVKHQVLGLLWLQEKKIRKQIASKIDLKSLPVIQVYCESSVFCLP